MAYQVIHGKLTKILGKVPRSVYGSKVPGTTYRRPENELPEEKPGKGKYLGLCNRTACQAPGPTWWNIGSHAYYCGMCAEMINMDGCRRYNEPDLCFKVTGFDEDKYPQYDPLAEKDYYAEYRD